MKIKFFLIICILIFGISSINYLDNKLDTIIKNQTVAASKADGDSVCGD